MALAFAVGFIFGGLAALTLVFSIYEIVPPNQD